MEQRPSWEANHFAAIQEIPRILWNPKVQLPQSQSPVTCLYPEHQTISLVPRFVCEHFVTKIGFHSEELLAPPQPLSCRTSAFFLGGRRGTRTPKQFVNITGESKNFKMLEFPLNQLQTYYGYLCDLLSFM
jgi:hypothetical protein